MAEQVEFFRAGQREKIFGAKWRVGHEAAERCQLFDAPFANIRVFVQCAGDWTDDLVAGGCGGS